MLQKQQRKFVVSIAKVSLLTAKSETGFQKPRPRHLSDLDQNA